jgi:aldose 1-epimerase
VAAPSWSARVLGSLADPDGTVCDVVAVTLAAGRCTAQVLSFGAHLVGLAWPDAEGRVDDVVAGWRDRHGAPVAAAYADPDDHPYLGALVGRYANRIAGARYVLDGVEHRLAANEGPHQLHGGPVGFDRRHWDLRAHADRGGAAAELTMTSPAGDQGHPGRLRVRVRYRLTVAGELRVTMTATTDAPTVVNLTTHPYWNLDGTTTAATASLDAHTLGVPEGDRFVEVDPARLPTGRLVPVEGDRLDLRAPRSVAALADVDHCLVRGRPTTSTVHAELASARSGRRIVLRSDQPGLQVYTAAHGAGPLPPGGAICLEPQLLPDAPNQPSFPPAVLRPGGTYRHEQRWTCRTDPA